MNIKMNNIDEIFVDDSYSPTDLSSEILSSIRSGKRVVVDFSFCDDLRKIEEFMSRASNHLNHIKANVLKQKLWLNGLSFDEISAISSEIN